MNLNTRLRRPQYTTLRNWASKLASLVLCLSIMLGSRELTAAELIMFEEAGCSWCEKWDEEIGVIYPRTLEGRLAPLRRVDIHARLPNDLRWITKAYATPTFILIHKGREYGRIRGYPGENFFWPLLQGLIKTLPGHTPSQPDLPDPSRDAHNRTAPTNKMSPVRDERQATRHTQLATPRASDALRP